MPGGYAGQLLRVDLTKGSWENDPLLDDAILRKYIGGIGLAMRIILDETSADEWKAYLSERRQEAVEEAKNEISSEQDYKIRQMSADAKKTLKDTLLSMKASGDLIFVDSGDNT